MASSPTRSLRFEHVIEDREWAQPVGTVNYPQTEAFTRISEYKHITGQVHARTTLTREYPSAEGDPYYPIPQPETQALYKKYHALAEATPDVLFVGRLATYRYYNMDQVIGQALATFRRIQEVRDSYETFKLTDRFLPSNFLSLELFPLRLNLGCRNLRL